MEREESHKSKQNKTKKAPFHPSHNLHAVGSLLGPGRMSNLAFSGEFAGTFSDTSLWGCQHSEIRKLKSGLPAHPRSSGLPAHPCFPRKSHESFTNETFLWVPHRGAYPRACRGQRRAPPYFLYFFHLLLRWDVRMPHPMWRPEDNLQEQGLCCHLGLGIRLRSSGMRP